MWFGRDQPLLLSATYCLLLATCCVLPAACCLLCLLPELACEYLMYVRYMFMNAELQRALVHTTEHPNLRYQAL